MSIYQVKKTYVINFSNKSYTKVLVQGQNLNGYNLNIRLKFS